MLILADTDEVAGERILDYISRPEHGVLSKGLGAKTTAPFFRNIIKKSIRGYQILSKVFSSVPDTSAVVSSDGAAWWTQVPALPSTLLDKSTFQSDSTNS